MLFGEHRDIDSIHSPSGSSTLYSPSPAQRVFELPSTPRLEINLLDTSPFLGSFSGLIDSDFSNSPSDSIAGEPADTSYDVERYTDLKNLDPEWDDDDVDEILILSRKASQKLPTIKEEYIEDHDNGVSMFDFETLGPTPCAELVTKPRLCRKRDTGRIYVLKTLYSCGNSAAEYAALRTISDLKLPFLPQILWSFWDNAVSYIVMDYYPKKSLQALVNRSGPLKPLEVLFHASELVQALFSLHAAGIVHRDLNPENVMIDTNGHVVLTGFKFSGAIQRNDANISDQCFLTNFPGELTAFQAPELILGWTHDFVVDCWGFGVLLYFMVCGAHLFGIKDGSCEQPSLKDQIVYNSIDLPLFEPLSRDLITKCLEKNPTARLSITSIQKHTYFSSVNWEKVAAKRIPVPSTWPVEKNSSETQINNKIYDFPRSRRSSIHSQRLPHVGQPSNTGSTDAIIATTPSHQHSRHLDLSVSLKAVPTTSSLTGMKSNDQMALFWEALDLERVAASPIPSLDDAGRPRKLRKSRSSIYPDQRFSALSTSLLHNKLRKRSQYHSPPPRKYESPSTLDLPDGIEQIGNGIGFTYSVPAATRSRTSICTNTPLTCHGIFLGFPSIGSRLNLKSGLSKATARCALLSPTTSRPYEFSGFPKDFGDSCWSLAVPMSPPIMDIGSAVAKGASNISPLTPTALAYEEPTITEKDIFENSIEVREGDMDTTLRLVPAVHTNVNGLPTCPGVLSGS